ncbi:hypothetical protein BYT27DRAFT_6888254 [Phlegmacium glaucopus]|nr:hypothetical protein BYT27DRAFT_6888254 [Phlegmacium glaucopus]
MLNIYLPAKINAPMIMSQVLSVNDSLRQCEGERKKDQDSFQCWMKEQDEKRRKEQEAFEKRMKEERRKEKNAEKEERRKEKRAEQEAFDKRMKAEQEERRKEKKAEQEAFDKRMKERDEQHRVERQLLAAQIAELQSQASDTSAYLVHGDTQALDRIKLRNLIDHAQAKFAKTAGLVLSAGNYDASAKWREALPDSDTKNRITAALDMLNRSNTPIDNATRQIMSSTSGMKLVTEKTSVIRLHGDRVAHGPVTREPYESAVGRYKGEKEGLCALIEYVCAP